jgi:glycosyltransferase involved in cell wall biosynthesis
MQPQGVAMEHGRILSISFDNVPSAKGAAAHIRQVAGHLGQRFAAVDLVTLPGALDAAPLELPGVTHHQIPARGPSLIERVLDFRTRLGLWWGRRRPEVVHVRSIWEGYPIAQRKASACERLVYEVNGLPSIELKYHYPPVAEDEVLLAKLRHQEDSLLAAADAVVTVSRVNRAYLIERGVPAERITVIPNGVELEACPWRVPDMDDALVDGGRPLRLLYCGTLSAWQGVRVAIEALALYRRDHPVELSILGPGRPRQRKELQALADRLGVAEVCHFLPPVDRAGLVAAHHEHDVALAPLLRNDRNCLQGCCPLKVLDAMACGTPVIASDLPVVEELARSGMEALLVRPGDPKAIKDGLLEFRRDRGLGRRLSATGRLRAQGRSWVNSHRLLDRVYDGLLAAPATDASKA